VVSTEGKTIGTILFGKTVTDESYQDLNMNFVSVLEVDEQDYWLQ